MSAPQTFKNELERFVDDLVITTVMDKVDSLAKKHRIPDDEVGPLLAQASIDGLDEAWLEYTE